MKYILLLLFPLVSAPSMSECVSLENANLDNTHENIINAIRTNLPNGWIVTSEQDNAIPYRHYWNMEYDGVRGHKIQLQGPEAVPVNWQPLEDESWRESFIAKEALTLWFMPLGYSQSWKRFLVIGKPAGAKTLYHNGRVKVFYHLSHRISDQTQFDRIISKANSLHWSSSPARTGEISWSSWHEDLLRIADYQESLFCS